MQPINSFVRPLLTDFYQLTMVYGYWKNGMCDIPSSFELFFRKNPFDGEFTVFAGIEEVLRFVSSFKITKRDVDYLRNGLYTEKSQLQKEFGQLLANGLIKKNGDEYYELNNSGKWTSVEYPDSNKYVSPLMKECEEDFFDWLTTIDCSKVKIYAMEEGSLIFPRMPIIRVEGPLAICQLLETTMLNLVNYASLVATNAARFRLAAGPDKILLEFGLRRAQGPDGGISASRYCYLGGFDATSNVMAGKLSGIPVRGTHAHSFVSSFTDFNCLQNHFICDKDGKTHDFVKLVKQTRQELRYNYTNEGELAAFTAYAQAFPEKFLALIDTYDSLKSGLPNFLTVGLALLKIGYKPVGVRLDSGDLAYLSKEVRKVFIEVSGKYNIRHKFIIVASNDINEETLYSLKEQSHEIDAFGIGTHLVTCQKQPALGAVYKLVEINGQARIKLSQEKAKMTIPGRKKAYRLIGKQGYPLLDIMLSDGEDAPKPNEQILCRHPFEAAKRVYVTPSSVIPLHKCVWDGHLKIRFPKMEVKRNYLLYQLSFFRKDHLRWLNPTPYKLSFSDKLYNFMHKLWLQEAPIAELE